MHRSREAPPLDDDMKHHAKVIGVQRIDHLLRLGKVRRMPGELSVPRVPSRGRELRAEVDERVARQLLFPHGSRDAENLIGPGERAVRLLITERPASGQLRQAGDARVFAHDDRGVV